MKPKQKLPKRKDRAYIIPYYTNTNENNMIKAIVGKEAVISPIALRSLKTNLNKENKKTQNQFLVFYDKLIKNQPIIEMQEGKPQIPYGDWAPGRHFGGILLAGCSTLPGGGINKDEEFKHAAIRELKEEFAIRTELDVLLDTLSDKLEFIDKIFVNNNRNEHYYALNVDNISHPAIRAELMPTTINDHIGQNTISVTEK